MQMKKLRFFILLFVGAICSSLSDIVEKEIRENDQLCQLDNKLLKGLQSSVSQVNACVAQNMKHINYVHNQKSCNSKIFENILYELQKNLTVRTEQIIDQKFASISKDFHRAALNTKKLQDSLDQLSIEHYETSSIFKALENRLNKILHQKIVSNSEDDQKSGHHSDTFSKVPLTDCTDLYNVGLNVSTSYFLPYYNREILCEMTTDGEGWLVIQRRQKINRVDFNKNWDHYKKGFGDVDKEFWMGNKFLHRITHQKSYELRIDMLDFEKGHFYATYSEFRVGNEESGYQLHLGTFEGNVTDSLSPHNKMKFSTHDRDNDNSSNRNCATYLSGGFWYYTYPGGPDRNNRHLIRWLHDGEYLIIKNVEMKIRPKH